MLGLGSFAHLIVAFFVPAAWAIILYPYCRAYHKSWLRLLILAIIFSFIAMVMKERFDATISVDDIVADMLGLFFGMALVAAIFSRGNMRFLKEGVVSDEKVSLRTLLSIAARIEEQSAVFYEKAALKMSDAGARELSLKISVEEKKHADRITAVLNGWLPALPDPDFIKQVHEAASRHGIYNGPFPHDISDQELLQYAIDHEIKMAGFYGSFKGIFPDEWRKSYVQELVLAEWEHERKLLAALRQLDSSYRTP